MFFDIIIFLIFLSIIGFDDWVIKVIREIKKKD